MTPTGPHNQAIASDLRRALLDAAIEAAAKQKVGSLDLTPIVESLGANPEAAKAVFADDLSLLSAIAVEGFLNLGQILADAVSGATNAIDALAASCEAYVAFSVTSPGYFHVMWHSELQGADDCELDMAVQATFNAIVGWVAAAQAEGWRVGEDPHELAVLTWSFNHGLAELYLDGPLAGLVDRDIHSLAAVNTRLFLNAANTESPVG